MKAVICPEYGNPEVLKVKEVAKPVPQEKEILVKVYSSAITTADTMMRKGTPKFARLFLGLRRPKQAIIGTGFAGVVEAVGDEVSQFKPGDNVFGETGVRFSAHAEYLTIAEDEVVLQKPDFLSFEAASALCDGVLTSYNFLKELANIQAGQEVLIIGGSGSLGSAAIQLAKYFDGRVSSVNSSRNVDMVTALGADHVIAYDQEDFTKSNRKYDIIFDTLGVSNFATCKAVLKANGRYICPVLNVKLLFQMLFTRPGKGKSALFSATGLKDANSLKKMLAKILTIIEAGSLRILIEKHFPMDEIVEAHRHIETGRKKGSLVLQIVSAHKRNTKSLRGKHTLSNPA